MESRSEGRLGACPGLEGEGKGWAEGEEAQPHPSSRTVEDARGPGELAHCWAPEGTPPPVPGQRSQGLTQGVLSKEVFGGVPTLSYCGCPSRFHQESEKEAGKCMERVGGSQSPHFAQDPSFQERGELTPLPDRAALS